MRFFSYGFYTISQCRYRTHITAFFNLMFQTLIDNIRCAFNIVFLKFVKTFRIERNQCGAVVNRRNSGKSFGQGRNIGHICLNPFNLRKISRHVSRFSLLIFPLKKRFYRFNFSFGPIDRTYLVFALRN